MKRLFPVLVTVAITGIVTVDSYKMYTQSRLTNQSHQATENVATSRTKSEKVVIDQHTHSHHTVTP